MPATDALIARIVTWIAGLAAMVIAVGLPLAYYYFGCGYEAGKLEAQAEVNAYLLTEIIGRNPTMWRYRSAHLDSFFAHQIHPTAPTVLRILSPDGAIINEHQANGHGALAWPVLARQHALYDAGRLVGQVEVARSVHPLLLRTGLVGMFSLLLGIGVFTAVRTLPLRALRRAWVEVSFLASHDPLTGLPNRALFNDRLGQALGRARRSDDYTVVLCLDLDHFKDVNDLLGHAAGDRLLKEAALRLQGCLRESDTLARMGGDEFAVILSGLSAPEKAGRLAQRFIDALARPFDLDGNQAVVGASIGIAVNKRDGLDVAQMLSSADVALYRAKAQGRGSYCFFEDDMNARLQDRKALEQDLRQALADEGLEVYYQPLVDLDLQRVVGVEALVRWRHPTRGMVSPADFIPLAEDTGLIIPLGDWVLSTACSQARAWSPLTLAVNLSPVQFRQANLAGRLAAILSETGFDPRRLEVEITEGVLLRDTEATLATLQAIKALGIGVAMDDFGTGYSSLSNLRRFPFNKIKIDGSFVRDMGHSEEAAAIVRAVISLGRSLGMRTTAECVETIDQVNHLRLEGCKEMQGFYYGRPMPAAEFVESEGFRAIVAATNGPVGQAA